MKENLKEIRHHRLNNQVKRQCSLFARLIDSKNKMSSYFFLRYMIQQICKVQVVNLHCIPFGKLATREKMQLSHCSLLVEASRNRIYL